MRHPRLLTLEHAVTFCGGHTTIHLSLVSCPVFLGLAFKGIISAHDIGDCNFTPLHQCSAEAWRWNMIASLSFDGKSHSLHQSSGKYIVYYVCTYDNRGIAQCLGCRRDRPLINCYAYFGGFLALSQMLIRDAPLN